ncbi:MAG: efflux RND transporter permease subunit [Deltaproteobacteria bacterium]|jgi:HAE1 family hydrophobic/amphiphilic exporter-1|nr:efflux RND transporter permease subunit [Deltaproteobacteria bacterium]
MSISEAAVKRPIFTAMAILIVLVLGVFSLSRLPLDLMPELTFPVITVRTNYENAAPGDVEEQITKPLERVLVAVPGTKKLTSVSSEGSSSIFIEFNWGTNLDEASNDIRDRIDRVVGRLPDEVDRPQIHKFDIASSPIMALGVASTFHPVDLKSYIEDEISYRLERRPGVASVQPFGGLDREFRVELDQSKVKALGLDLASLSDLIKNENLSEAGGELDRGRLSVALRTKGEFTTLNDLGSILVTGTPGRNPVFLRDIADIFDGWKKISRITRVNSQEGQFMGLFKQSGSNTVDVASTVYGAIDELNSTLPNILITVLRDASVYIKRSIRTVTISAILGGLLAIGVILFFLQSVRSTLVLSLAIPISIIATFVCMYFAGFTLNVVTMGSLALGVGMLVDNSIVVLDNIFRHRSNGLSSKEAAIQGTNEVTGAIVASTLTTLSVFTPLIFLTGMAGVLFRPFALTICFALTSSLVVAITLVPMLFSQFFKSKDKFLENGLESASKNGQVSSNKQSSQVNLKKKDDNTSEQFGKPRVGKGIFKAVDGFYAVALAKALKNPVKVLVMAVVLLVLSIFLATRVTTEFLPRTDEGEFSVFLTMEPGTRVEETSRVMRQIEEIVKREVPEIVQTATDIGGTGGFQNRGSHKGEFEVKLVPMTQRSRSLFEIMDDLRPKVSDIPGATVRIRAEQSFLVRGVGDNADKIQVELRGNDLDEAYRLSQAMKKVVEAVPGVSDVYLSNEDTTPEELILIDRDRAADAALSVNKVSSLIKTAIGGNVAGYFRVNGKEYDIRVKLKDSEGLSIDEIMKLPVLNSRGEKVILGNVAHVQGATSPLSITRKNQQRITTLNADLTNRSLGEVVADIDKELKKVPMGRDFSYGFAGEAEELQETFQGLRNVLIMSIFLVYMVMACQFEQLKGPLVIMFSLPFAAIGVIWAHFLTGISFNINSFIGVIMLAGIVVNNAIILVDHANLLRRRDKMELIEALIETGRRRLRPIMMTSLTTILGLIPMALGMGEGAESQIPLGRAVIGGLASSTFITLFVVPIIYMLFYRKQEQEELAKAKEALTLGEPKEALK